MRSRQCFRIVCAALLAVNGVVLPAETLKLTGRFTCEKCAAPRAAKGDFSIPNPICAQKCITEGSEAVFVSEEPAQLLKVRNLPNVKENIGYKVEVTGDIDRSTKTITVRTVTKLAEEGAACGRPRPTAK